MEKLRGNSTCRAPYHHLSKEQRRLNHAVAQELNICARTIGRRGDMNRSIIAECAEGNVERSFHATKGLRIRSRVPA